MIMIHAAVTSAAVSVGGVAVGVAVAVISVRIGSGTTGVVTGRTGSVSVNIDDFVVGGDGNVGGRGPYGT